MNERKELLPWHGKEDPRTHDTAKVKALYALIAEKLLAMEGRRAGIGEDASSRLLSSVLQKAFVRDELYRREIGDKVVITEEELADGLRKASHELNVLMLSVHTRSDADSLVRFLSRSPEPHASIEMLPRGFLIRRDTLLIRFGNLDIALEAAAFALEESAISRPIFSRLSGWTVLILLKRDRNPATLRMSMRDRQQYVENLLRQRKAQRMAHRFSLDVLSGKTARTDSTLFSLLVDTLSSVVSQTPRPLMMSYWAEYLLTLFEPYHNHPFVIIEESSMTLAEVLQALQFESRLLTAETKREGGEQLNAFIKRVVELEFLSREGVQRGLHQSREVQRDLQRWMDAWVAQEWTRKLLDTIQVQDEEIIRFMMDNVEYYGQRYEVNVREVLVEKLEHSIEILEKLAAGDDLGTLARERTRRNQWRDHEGESGYFAVSKHPELGVRALAAETGSVVGPVRLPEGYSLFIVLGKRKKLEEAWEVGNLLTQARQEVLKLKQDRVMSTYLANLAQKYRIEIRMERIRALEVMPSPMFTRRLIGFGGK